MESKPNSFKNVQSSTKEELELFLTTLAKVSPKLNLFAIGGTAMVLENVKSVTKDIDFVTDETREKIYALFTSVNLKRPNDAFYRWVTSNGINIDISYDSTIMGKPLKEDWINLSKKLKEYGKITLWRLNWYDIIINKMDRGEMRDFEDIKMIIEKENINVDFLIDRFLEVAETGIMANRHRKALDLVELKFKEWHFSINKTLIDKIKRDEHEKRNY